MKRNILIAFAATSLLFYSSQAFALISVSAGVPFSHSFSKDYKSDGTSGYFLAVELPVLVGVGIDKYKTKDKETPGMKIETSMYNIFYTLPIPIINLTLGLGMGETELTCPAGTLGSGTPVCSTIYDKGSASQWYTSVGMPILPFFDLHLSYRSVTAKKMKVKAPYGDETLDFSGSVMGLGIKFGF